MKFVLCALFLLSTSLEAAAQDLSIQLGGKIGVPLTRNIPAPFNPGQTTITPQGPRLTMAPTFTLLVDDRLTVDVEALFRPIRYETATLAPTVSTFDKTRATALEVPVILSYHFAQGSRFRPYAGAGLVAYERAWGKTNGRGIIHSQGDRETNVVFTYFGSKSESPPLLVSGGLDYVRAGVVVRPEIRYTHSSGSSGRVRNQWDVFVGITFRSFHRENRSRP